MANVLPLELTVGWPISDQGACDARKLHDHAKKRAGEGGSYDEALLAQLRDQHIHRIERVDDLLRRRKDGFSEINQFTASLLNVIGSFEQFKVCRIDLFAFSFLKYAKNYDLFMAPFPDNVQNLLILVKEWQEVVQALEDFERLGKTLRPEFHFMKNIYLKLRAAVSRPSARDEQRCLAVLLESGPSTLDDISIDLGLSYSLNRRIMTVFQEAGVIECRRQGDDDIFFVTTKALPVALFLLRETVGLDLLTMAARMLEER